MCFAVARRPCSSSTAFEVAVGLVTVELLPTGGRGAALGRIASRLGAGLVGPGAGGRSSLAPPGFVRSEEHTSGLQSRLHPVCRPLLGKKKQRRDRHPA